MNQSENPVLSIRQATPEDTSLILAFIRDLAQYEKLSDAVVATEDTLRKSLFGEKAYAEVLIGYCDDTAAGFAVFFHNFSTFVGRPGIYLEDLYVRPEFRGCGLGKALLSYVAKLAVERNCGRFEWSVLDWNTPSIEFYKRLGARPMAEWTVYRVTGKELVELSEAGTDYTIR